MEMIFVRLWNESENVIDHATDLLNAELWNITPEVLTWDVVSIS